MTALYPMKVLPYFENTPQLRENGQYCALPSPLTQRSVVQIPNMYAAHFHPQKVNYSPYKPFLQPNERAYFRRLPAARLLPIKRINPPYSAAYDYKKTQPSDFPSVFQSRFRTFEPTKRDSNFTHIVHALRYVPNSRWVLQENVPTSLIKYIDRGTLDTLATTLNLRKIIDVSYLGTYPLQTISLKGLNKNNVPVYKIFTYNRKDSSVTNFQDIPVANSLNAKEIKARSKKMYSLKNLTGNEQIMYSLKNITEKQQFDTSIKNMESLISVARGKKMKGASLLVNSVRVPIAHPYGAGNDEFYAMKMTGVPLNKFLNPIIENIPANDVQTKRKKLLPYLQLWGRDSLAAARCVESLGYGITDQKLSNSILVKDAKGEFRSAQIDIDDLTPLNKSDITYTYPHRELIFSSKSTHFSTAEKKVLLRMRNIAVGLVDKLLSKDTLTIGSNIIRDYFKNLPSVNSQTKQQIETLIIEIKKVLSTYYGIKDSEAILFTNLIVSPQALLYPDACYMNFPPDAALNGTSQNRNLQQNFQENLLKIENILDKMTDFGKYKEPVFNKGTSSSNVAITEVKL